jgi:hypothetical protein
MENSKLVLFTRIPNKKRYICEITRYIDKQLKHKNMSYTTFDDIKKAITQKSFELPIYYRKLKIGKIILNEKNGTVDNVVSLPTIHKKFRVPETEFYRANVEVYFA